MKYAYGDADKSVTQHFAMPASDEDDELDRLFDLDATGSPNPVHGAAPSANSAAAPPTRANVYDIDEEIKFVKQRRVAPKLDGTR